MLVREEKETYSNFSLMDKSVCVGVGEDKSVVVTGSVESSACSNVPLSFDLSPSVVESDERGCFEVDEGGEGSPGRASKIEIANVPDLPNSVLSVPFLKSEDE